MYVHCWFATKRRKWALTGELAVLVKDALREAASQHEVNLVEIECMVDHVHVLLKVEDASKLRSTMHLLKGRSARTIFQAVPDLKLDMGTESFWQRGYGSKVVDPGAVTSVSDYINAQQDRVEKYERW